LKRASLRAPHPASRVALGRGLGAGVIVALLLASCGDTEDLIARPRAQSAGDAGVELACLGPMTTDEGVVALFTFDTDQGKSRVADVVGGHDGSVQLGAVATVAGPEGCGEAFSFGASEQYFVVDDASAWDLEVGSLDLWLWLPTEMADSVGVLSRDLENRDAAGHFSAFVDSDGRAVVRIQPLEDGLGNDTDAVVCSEAALPRDRWVHLGINFGPPSVDLYVDGEPAAGAGATALSDEWRCGQPGAWGLSGNELPWVVGRTAFRSPTPLEELEFPATGCAIDHLRISRERRAFDSYF